MNGFDQLYNMSMERSSFISTFIYLARIFRGGTVHLAEAQDFTPVSSCSSGLSTFAGIVCSSNYVDGKVIHCIFDENFQLGLVCTEWQQTLPGRCPRYLEEFKEVGDFPCTGGECPDVFFPSHEAYKYPACLNKSLYITEPTTTPADTTEKSISCRDCVDGGSSGQSMSLAVPVAIAVSVPMASFCLLMVWEYCTKKPLQEVICGSLKNVYRGHRTTNNEQVTQREAEQCMTSEGEDTDHRGEQV